MDAEQLGALRRPRLSAAFTMLIRGTRETADFRIRGRAHPELGIEPRRQSLVRCGRGVGCMPSRVGGRRSAGGDSWGDHFGSRRSYRNRQPRRWGLISLDGAAPAAQTSSTGQYRLTGVSPGNHVVSVRRVGYATVSKNVDVTAGATARLDFTLSVNPATLGNVTVIGTRTDLDETRERAAEVPGAVAIIGPSELRSTRQANLNDVLSFTPGVFVQPRFGAADESQISIRGSGLRNNFHARGLNLLVNGMPYRNADGFTDFESLELLTTESIEVYKGANALRYGGSTLGGGVNLDTKTGYTADRVSLFAQGGGFGFYKAQLASGDTLGAFDYYASYARTGLDGYREWSESKTRPGEPAWWLPIERAAGRADVLLLRACSGAPARFTDARAVRRRPRAGRAEQRDEPVGSGLRPPSRGCPAPGAAYAGAAARDQPVPAVP